MILFRHQKRIQMTDIIDIQREAFREEAKELLNDLEEALLELERQPTHQPLLDRVFRAMHTIKGSSAMCGFDNIADFTHVIENVLDQTRAGNIFVDKPLIDLILASSDQVRMMVGAEYGGRPFDPKSVEFLISTINQHCKLNIPPKENQSHPGLAQQQTGKEASVESMSCYLIKFHPKNDIFSHGIDPLLILDELRELGEAHITADLENIPPLEEINPTTSYVYWNICLVTHHELKTIQDVFIFVEDDSKIEIVSIDPELLDEEQKEFNALIENFKRTNNSESVESTTFAPPPSPQEPPPFTEEIKVSLPTDAGTPPPLEEAGTPEILAEKESPKGEIKSNAPVATIRVPADRLDELVTLVGELVTMQARLSQMANIKSVIVPELTDMSEEMERLTADLRDSTMNIRMVPVGSLFSKFTRVTRDVSNSLGVEVDLVTVGDETELDKTIIERLNDPLMHLLRNSIGHGIELPEDRENAGKPRRGTIQISAAHVGSSVVIKIEDDGAGINTDEIRRKAIEKKLISPDATLSEKETFDLIFKPGFSTAKQVDNVSGRGVGMDVVREGIESLRGSISVASTPGKGTKISLRLPLTLAIIDSLMVMVADKHFVIPLSVIEECVELNLKDEDQGSNTKMITFREEMIPLIHLRERFSLKGVAPELEQIVIATVEGQRLGLVVDRVVGTHQTVIKSLGRVFRHIDDVSGATILGDGSIALILNVSGLLEPPKFALTESLGQSSLLEPSVDENEEKFDEITAELEQEYKRFSGEIVDLVTKTISQQSEELKV